MKYLSIILLVTLGCTATAQQWSGALSLGYSNADITVAPISSFVPNFEHGVAARAEALYHFPSTDARLGLGILAAANLQPTDQIGDVTTALSQSFYGGKVLYHFSRGKFSPFVSLAAGVGTTRIERFDESVNERTSSDAHLQFSVIPQVGISIGRVDLAVDYIPKVSSEAFTGFQPLFETSFLTFSVGYRIRE